MRSFGAVRRAADRLMFRRGAVAVLLAAAAAGGCSNQVSRFDGPRWGLTESQQRARPAPVAPVDNEPDERLASAPSASGDGGRRYEYRGGRDPVTGRAEVTIGGNPAVVASAETGGVEVRPGDTLSSIAKKHGTTVAALMAANKLTSASIRPGQRLALPAR